MRKIAKIYLIPLFILAITFCGGGVGIPELINPVGGEQVSSPVTLTWSSVEDAGGYAVEVDTTTDFESPVVSAETTDTSYGVSSLDTIMYYWRVAAIDEDNEQGDFSDPDSFMVTGGGYPRNLLTTIDVLEYPQSIDITPDGSELWVNHWGQYDTMVYVISTASNQVTHQIPATNVGDNELRISADGNYAYYCGTWNMDSSGILEFSTSSYSQTRIIGFLEGSPPIKHGPEGYGVALTQANDYVYAAHMATAGDGCITKFDVSTGALVDSILLPWIWDVDLNHAEDKLYAVSQDLDIFYEIDPANMTITNQLTVGSSPEIILITNDDQYAFVTCDSIYVVDLNNFSVVTKFDPDIFAFGMKITPDENYLFICDSGSDFISVFDINDPTNPTMVEKLEFPDAGSFTELVFNADGSRAYVVESNGKIFVLEK